MVSTFNKFLSLVRFSHTVFALPFALAGFILASRDCGFEWIVLLWVLLCMVTARNAAMGFNRIVDRDIDSLNPRTMERELPKGSLRLSSAIIFTVINTLLFVLFAFMLNQLCGWLSLPALGILFLYSLSKRFTWGSQLILGLSLAIAPIGAWLAVCGEFDPRIFLMAGAVLFWVAGFDIFYASLDYDFDVAHGLNSIPAKWGVGAALVIARILHLISIGFMISIFFAFSLGMLYLVGTAVVGAVLIFEGLLVRKDDLSKAMLAFNLNGFVSLFYIFVIFLDVVIFHK
jgi:4-hydroxybenzoate polyprenyltransferase